MIRFILVSKRKDGDSYERFNYEWGILHTSLMLTTKSVAEKFQRYVQHRTAAEVPADALEFVRAPRGFYMMSDHSLRELGDLQYIFTEGEYTRRMQPHKFGSDEFIIELMSNERVLFEIPDFRHDGRGVKVLNFIRRKPDVSLAEFSEWWTGDWADRTIEVAEPTGIIRRYAQSTQLPLNAELFKGTLFEAGGVQTYSGVEETWFRSAADLARFSKVRAHLREESSVYLADDSLSFTMPVVERVVFDKTRGGRLPAILDPESVEAQMWAGERAPGEWDKIYPVDA